MKQALIFVTAALLLVQLAHSLPHKKREAVTTVESTEDSSPKVILMTYTLAEITKLSKWALDNGVVVIKHTVNELNELPVKDELLQANITRMSKVVKEISDFSLNEEDPDSLLKLFINMMNFANMLGDYQNMPEDSKLKLTLKTALENNGFTKFETEFESQMVDFAESFDKAFGEYVKALSPAEKENDSKLLKWFDEYKTETEEDNKLDKFGEFFNILN